MLVIASTAAGSSASSNRRTREPQPDSQRETASGTLQTEPTEPQPKEAEEGIAEPAQAEWPTAMEDSALQYSEPSKERAAPVMSRKSGPAPVPKPKPAYRAIAKEPESQPKRAASAEAAGIDQNVRENPAADTALTPSSSPSGDGGADRQTQLASSGGADTNEYGDYLAALRSWLQSYKRYPRRARLGMLKGEARISFVLDRSGRVVSYELSTSTGHDALDREVLAMIQRAAPMPAFPPNLNEDTMRFSLPVRFELR